MKKKTLKLNKKLGNLINVTKSKDDKKDMSVNNNRDNIDIVDDLDLVDNIDSIDDIDNIDNLDNIDHIDSISYGDDKKDAKGGNRQGINKNNNDTQEKAEFIQDNKPKVKLNIDENERDNKKANEKDENPGKEKRLEELEKVTKSEKIPKEERVNDEKDYIYYNTDIEKGERLENTKKEKIQPIPADKSSIFTNINEFISKVVSRMTGKSDVYLTNRIFRIFIMLIVNVVVILLLKEFLSTGRSYKLLSKPKFAPKYDKLKLLTVILIILQSSTYLLLEFRNKVKKYGVSRTTNILYYVEIILVVIGLILYLLFFQKILGIIVLSVASIFIAYASSKFFLQNKLAGILQLPLVISLLYILYIFIYSARIR